MVMPLRADIARAERWPDACAIAVLAAVALIAAATFQDYGLGWDDWIQSHYGHLLVSLYSSDFTDKRAFSLDNLYMYGGGFDLLAALTSKVLPFDPYATRRLLGAVIGIVGLFAVWRLTRRLGGPFAGLIALILLATCPLFYGHMFINCKDAPFAVVMILALLGIVHAIEQYPRPDPATVALLSVAFGLAVGTRVLGGFAVIEAFLSLVLIVGIRWRSLGLKIASAECATFLLPFIPGALLAYLVMGLVWPWGVAEPLNPFRALHYFSHDFVTPWNDLFDGKLVSIVHMPRSYVPTLLAVQLPELMLALGLCGFAGALVAVCRPGSGVDAKRRASLLAIVLAVSLPILMTVVTLPYIFNGIRHLLFVVPPIAVLGGLAGAWIGRRLADYGRVAIAAGAVALAAGTISPIIDMIRLHPYEYTDFNHFVGGAEGARPLFMLDYWGLSLTQASRGLIAYLAQHHETPPNGPWKVAVCGPESPVWVTLGPAFKLAAPAQADFALSVGEFYCAKLDAPVLLQIVRDGIVFARVYDIRGRSIEKLTAK
jgi:4-amino-4-deoxy-L-arabinose transferase-like glycosyltransferase